MDVGTTAEAGLGTVVGSCGDGEWMKGLLVEEEEFTVDRMIGVNVWFGMGGDAFNDMFPLPSPELEVPDCTDTVRTGSVCVLPLLAMAWECTHDDRTCRNS